jgi:hypothetical protein
MQRHAHAHALPHALLKRNAHSQITPHVGDPKTWAARVLVLGYAFLVLIIVHLFTGVRAGWLHVHVHAHVHVHHVTRSSWRAHDITSHVTHSHHHTPYHTACSNHRQQAHDEAPGE